MQRTQNIMFCLGIQNIYNTICKHEGTTVQRVEMPVHHHIQKVYNFKSKRFYSFYI